MKRRQALAALAALAAGAGTATAKAATAESIAVWKSPSCGCCADWVKHVEAAGFRVTVHDSGNNAARARLGIPAKLGSCHTGEVAGYALEGHVPASEIRKLLAERPDARGLAVPGMPLGSPGMEMGSTRDAYDVLLVLRDGTTRVYARYAAQ